MIDEEHAPISEDGQTKRLIFDTVAVRALGQVLEVARQAGAVVAPVKGVVLARWLYGQTYQRPYRDLDLLATRQTFTAMSKAVHARGWPIAQESLEMGQLEFVVDKIMVEVQGEFGRRDLSRLTTDEVLARAAPEQKTFPFEIQRIDDIDHFLLLVANVTKKAFTYSNPHQPADLNRLIVLLEPRWDELVERAHVARFLTGVRNVAAWMIEEHQSAEFVRFSATMAAPRRRLFAAAVRRYRRAATRRPDRLTSASGMIGLALVILTPDDRSLQLKGLARLVRRGAYRRLRRHPG